MTRPDAPDAMRVTHPSPTATLDELLALDLLTLREHTERAEGAWFVRAFNTHPAHRNAPVLQSLMRQVGDVARREGIRELRSHVYRTNALSMAFHQRLGFHVGRENGKAVEFIASIDRIADRPALARRARRPGKETPGEARSGR